MADITLQNNQSLVLRLKACGLSNADIKKVLAALSPELENKANVTLENVTDEAFKAKAKTAGIGSGGGSGGAVSSVNGQTGDVNLTASDVGAAWANLMNVSDADFLMRLNAVLPDGDEVSY